MDIKVFDRCLLWICLFDCVLIIPYPKCIDTPEISYAPQPLARSVSGAKPTVITIVTGRRFCFTTKHTPTHIAGNCVLITA
jgi:hypothetical protein